MQRMVWFVLFTISFLGAILARGDETRMDKELQSQIDEIADRASGVLGCAIVDLTSGEQWAVEGDTIFPQASAIKATILMETIRQAHAGELNLDEIVKITKQNHVSGSGILVELGDGTVQMSVRDLCVLMIALSDNTATNLLIDRIGMDRVNAMLRDAGATQTALRRRMMDLAARKRGIENISTPYEAAQLMQRLHEGKFVSREVSNDVLSILRKPKEGDIQPALPQGVPMASKTGELPGILTEWAIVELPGRPYVLVIMGKDGDSKQFSKAFQDVSAAAYRHFSRLSIKN
ncbi:MAG: serine hydrolase [Pirellulales bacterium]